MFSRVASELVFALLFYVSLIPGGLLKAQTEEPPRLMDLKINGQSHRIVVGQKLELDLSGKTEVELVELPNRLFGHGGVEFQYPARFVFEADIDDESAAWHLDTDIAGLIFEEIPVEEVITAEEIAQQIVAEFEVEAQYVAREIKLGETAVKGIEAVFLVDETTYSYEVYPIATTGGHRFLVLQDFLDENGENSRDYFELRNAITRSFRVLNPEVRRYVK